MEPDFHPPLVWPSAEGARPQNQPQRSLVSDMVCLLIDEEARLIHRPSFMRQVSTAGMRVLVLVLKASYLLTWQLGKRRSAGLPRKLCIAAGTSGWELIEYQELHQSATEYLGEDAVLRLTVSKPDGFASEIRAVIAQKNPSHFYYDPRTGPQSPIAGFISSIQIGFLLSKHRIVPIGALTDFPVRRWRRQVAVVTALRGIVLSLAAPEIVSPYFPHRRLIGPMPMAFSKRKLDQLDNYRRTGALSKPKSFSVRFIGAMYEPRKTVIEAIKSGLQNHGIDLEIISRELSGRRFTDKEYWERIQEADLIVSTSRQIGGRGIDDVGETHLIYRTTEVTAAGTALMMEHVGSMDRYFMPDRDVVTFHNPTEAIEKILSLARGAKALESIRKSGHDQAGLLIRGSVYWLLVDTCLGRHGLK